MMSTNKYQTEIDLENKNNSHTLIVDMVGGGKRVLEVGCASGYMSRALTERGCTVVGLEINPDAALEAKEFCEDVIVGDVETFDLESVLGTGNFDAVTFGDVLEHLRDPIAALRRIRPLLAPGGYVVTSLPNVAHGSVRLALLKGRFDYTPLGLLDETHLRLFTLAGIRKMFRDAGMVMVQTERVEVDVFATEVKIQPEEFAKELIDEIQSAPEARTYQFVTKAVVDDAFSAIQDLHDRVEAVKVTLAAAEQRAQSAEQQLEGMTLLQEQLDMAREQLSQTEDFLKQQEQRWSDLEKRFLMRLYRLARGQGPSAR